MNQENKELLLKDLCSRLPYKVQASYYGAEEECECWDEVEGIVNDYVEIGQYSLPIEAVKPYLFPFTSMTEGQKEEYVGLQQRVIYNSKGLINSDVMEYVNWCYKNHIDINNLIPMGLAIDCTNLNIY